MAWIESHQTLQQHPKTKRLARRLGISVPTAIGHLHCLWWWAMDYAPDGDISDYDAEDIADAAMWEGDPQEFIAALIECGPGGGAGFVDRDGDTLRLHDWEDYRNEYRARKAAAERKRRSRERRRAVTEMSRDSHAAAAGQDRGGHADVTTDRTERTDRTREDRQTPPYPPDDGGDTSVGPEDEAESADLKTVVAHYRQQIGEIGPTTFFRLAECLEVGMEPGVVMAAIDRTAEARAAQQIRGSPDSYLLGVLRHWRNDGVRTADDLRERNRRDPRSSEYDPAALILEQAAAIEAALVGRDGG